MQKGRHPRETLVAVAIDKNSLSAFCWALDNLVTRGQTLIIIHVNTKSSDSTSDNALREIFIPYRCFCARKDVHCKDIILEDPDVAKAIAEFVLQSSIEKLVIGESPPPKDEFDWSTDLSSSIRKAVPDFCTVIVVSKGEVVSTRRAIKSAPPPLRPQSPIQAAPKPEIPNNIPRKITKVPEETESIKSPFTKGGNTSSTRSYENAQFNSQTIMSEVEEEIRQLKLELKEAVDMYNSACKEAIAAKQKEKEQRTREARVAEKVALALAETEGGNSSSTRPFLNNVRLSFEYTDPPRSSNASNIINYNFKSPRKSVGAHSLFGDGNPSISSKTAPSNSQVITDEEMEEGIRKLRLELKGMYNSAFKEAIAAMQKAEELQGWKMEKELWMREARVEEE